MKVTHISNWNELIWVNGKPREISNRKISYFNLCIDGMDSAISATKPWKLIEEENPISGACTSQSQYKNKRQRVEPNKNGATPQGRF